MKILLITLLLLGFKAEAGYVRGYIRKGSYVRPHVTKKPGQYKGFKPYRGR